MLSTMGVGGHTPSPQTLMFHLHVATRHLAKALEVPSAPDISRVSRSCHRTSSSLIPWVATSKHHLALQLASISVNASGSSSPMSTQAMNCHAELPPEASICSAAGSLWLPSSYLTTQCTGVCGSESPPPHLCHHPVRSGPHPLQSG